MKKLKLLPEHELYRYLVKAILVVIFAYGFGYYNHLDAEILRGFIILVLGIYTFIATARIDEDMMVITVPLAVIAWVSCAFIPAGVAVLAHVTVTDVWLAIDTTKPFDSNGEINRASFGRAKSIASVIMVIGAVWWFFYLSHLHYIL